MREAFGPWVLIRRIARGGMAEVFLAEHADDANAAPACIKRILPEFLSDEVFRQMFIDEARLSQHLDHENIVHVLGYGDVDGRLWLAMDYVYGPTLEGVMEMMRGRGAAVPPPAAIAVALQLCRALRHAHSLQIDGRPQAVVHRDVSPANVLLTVNGDVKLTDFGVARARDRLARTRPGTTKGKEPWMSPEQARGERVDHRSDQFAVGILLWEMLTGDSLFGGGHSAEILARVVRCEVPVPSSRMPGVPRDLDIVVGRALSPSPGSRYLDMADLEGALLGCGLAEADGRDALEEIIEEVLVEPQRTSERRRPTLGVARADPARAPPTGATRASPISWLRVALALGLGGLFGVVVTLVTRALTE
jgi:serine/threonine protein kinase